MSRSRINTPILGNTTCRSEKQDKRQNNRRLRVAVRKRVHADPEGVMPHVREISNPWSMGKDGRQWVGDLVGEHPEWVRK